MVRRFLPSALRVGSKGFADMEGISFTLTAETLRRKIVKNILFAMSIGALVIVCVTFARLVIEGWQPMFPVVWIASFVTLFAFAYSDTLSFQRLSILMWFVWTLMSMSAFVFFGLASMGPVFLIIATSCASLGFRFPHVILLVIFKVLMLAAIVLFMFQLQIIPVPIEGSDFLEDPHIWIFHTVLFGVCALLVVYSTAALVKFYVEFASSSREMFYIGVGLISLARDTETGSHLRRISRYCVLLYDQHLQAENLSEEEVGFSRKDLELASVLHDIGKIAIPDAILRKPGRLTEAEFTVVKEHTTIGARIIWEIQTNCGEADSKTMGLAADIALSHHESWSGGGYPAGLLGKAIPLAARIVSICDVYDALRSERPYKKGWSHEAAVEEIAVSGQKFDPHLLELFLKNNEIFDDAWTAMKS
jgi:HD-GYP domain-containing protein (c-di-GMP phosphodiesterase class II)